MPTFCPLMDRHFVDDSGAPERRPGAQGRAPRQRQLRSGHRHAGGAARSTRASSGPTSTRWTFLTGDRDDIDQFAGAVRRVASSRAPNDPRDITHNLRTAIVDRRRQARQGLHGQRVDAEHEISAADGQCRPIATSIQSSGHRQRANRHSTLTRASAALIARLRTPPSGPALPQPPALQHRAGTAARRCAASAASSAHGCAHCLEAALFAAVVLEQHGYPPLVLSFESIDHLDHVIFVYQQRGRWGSVARSRDPGLHGRRAGLRDAARARAQLRRSVRRLHRPRHRLRGRRRREGDGHATTGGWRRPTSGRSSACCSTTRTGGSRRRTRVRSGCARGIARSRRRTRAASRSATAAASGGRSCRDGDFGQLVPIRSVAAVEIPRGLRDRAPGAPA